MNDYNPNYQYGAVNGTMDMSVDKGLRSFMLGVYNKMGLGLVWSGFLAYAAAYVAPVRDLLYRTVDGDFVGFTGLGWAVAFGPAAILLLSGFLLRNPSKTAAGMLYWGVVTLMGLGLGVWCFLYTTSSLATTFFVTAAAFGGLSLFGYTTKKDLSGFGSFLIMAVIGLFLAMIVNMFLKSSIMDMVISGAGVLIFSGLIAFRTQNLKQQYYAIGGNETALSVASSYGALGLYVDFINLFQFLLRFLGDRR